MFSPCPPLQGLGATGCPAKGAEQGTSTASQLLIPRPSSCLLLVDIPQHRYSSASPSPSCIVTREHVQCGGSVFDEPTLSWHFPLLCIASFEYYRHFACRISPWRTRTLCEDELRVCRQATPQLQLQFQLLSFDSTRYCCCCCCLSRSPEPAACRLSLVGSDRSIRSRRPRLRLSLKHRHGAVVRQCHHPSKSTDGRCGALVMERKLSSASGPGPNGASENGIVATSPSSVVVPIQGSGSDAGGSSTQVIKRRAPIACRR